MLLYILQNSFNHCYIVDSYQSMNEVLSALLENDFQPESVLTFGTKVRYFDIQGHCTISFVCRQEYLAGTLSEIAEMFLEEKNGFTYAPMQMIHESFVDYVGQIPDFHYFKEIFDTEADIARKTKHYASLEGVFNMKDCLKTAAMSQGETMLKAVTEFVKLMLDFQCDLLSCLKVSSDKKRLPILGPFTNHVSLANFSYNMTRYFSQLEDHLYAIDAPCGKKTATSKPECMYTFFMAWKNESAIHALSHSSNKLSQLFWNSAAIPDLLIPETSLKKASAHFYNGCV
jgi:hypothetical protein